MKIPLSEFELHIDDKILERGLRYFKKGMVQYSEELSPGNFEFVVHGTDEYTVRLWLSGTTLVDQVCSCPYDLGPICKHVTACLFFLQQTELGLPAPEQNEERKKEAKTKRVKKTVEEQLDEILEKIPEADLKEFVRNLAISNREFRMRFLSLFTRIGTADSIKTYKSQIRGILKGAAGRHGFIDYRSAQRLSPLIDEYIDSARRHLQKGNTQTAYFICAAVMEEGVKALQYADDSDGIIGGCIDLSFEILSEAARNGLFTEDLRKDVFNYCLDAYRKNLFEGWNWHLDLLDVATTLVNEKKEYQEVSQLLDSTPGSEYMDDRLILLKLNLLRKINDDKAVTTFIKKNIAVPEIREMEIEAAFTNKDYEKVDSLAMDGVSFDKKKRPGLVNHWIKYLLRSAQIKNEKEKIIEYATLLFIDGRNPKEEYYSILKEQIAVKEWSGFLDTLMKTIQKTRSTPNYLISWIFEQEEMWDKLMDCVRQDPDIITLNQYSKQLAPYYADELAQLYQDLILKLAKTSSSRSQYKEVCQEIKKMKLLGAGERVQKLLSTLKENFKHRPAMIEELSKL